MKVKKLFEKWAVIKFLKNIVTATFSLIKSKNNKLTISEIYTETKYSAENLPINDKIFKSNIFYMV